MDMIRNKIGKEMDLKSENKKKKKARRRAKRAAAREKKKMEEKKKTPTSTVKVVVPAVEGSQVAVNKEEKANSPNEMVVAPQPAQKKTSVDAVNTSSSTPLNRPKTPIIAQKPVLRLPQIASRNK